ncbi:MAG: hypothetical protein WC682_04320 [Parcubacteria group bacterium]|jgi:hypothetical protein
MIQGGKLKEEAFICPTCGFNLNCKEDEKHVCLEHMLRRGDVLQAIEEALMRPRTKLIMKKKLGL